MAPRMGAVGVAVLWRLAVIARNRKTAAHLAGNNGFFIRARLMTVLDALPQTLTDALAQAARKRGSAAFLIDGDVELSYAGLDAASARVAAGLLAVGIRRGTASDCSR